jgi:glycosyltransferase involved in cell wall biosynthesis
VLSEQVAQIVRRSSLFDAEDYRQRAGLGSDANPAMHYVTEGERLGIAPSADFDPVYYAERYPDVAGSGLCLLVHYIQHGQREARRGRPVAKAFAPDPARFAPDKETILLVSHEGSRTGAPILALTIGQSLRAQYNLVTVLLRGGDLVDSFGEISSHLICLNDGDRNPVEFKYINSFLQERAIRYAIVNSIESRDLIPVLSRAFIPTVNLIHEFSSYTRPLRAVREALGWTTELVFSTNTTFESFCKEHPALRHRRVHVMPQGAPSIPARLRDTDNYAERNSLRTAIRPASAREAFVVLGAGFVHIRKGIDLFISSAAEAIRLAGKRHQLRFVWIGKGFDPEMDVSYSGYLAEQITRSGLEDHFILLDEVQDLEPAFDLADVFYLPSRLDPLPNVTIEAALRGLPVICFEGSTGMAEILQRDRVAGKTVVPHLDSHAAAHRIVELAKDKKLRDSIGEATSALAQTTFDMDRYVRRIDEIGGLAAESMRQRRADFETIVDDPLFEADISLPPTADASARVREVAVSRFLAYWSAARTAPHQLDHLDFRRPCVGFNPQIYAHNHPKLLETDINPLADFIRKGYPKGSWVHDVIRPDLAKLRRGRWRRLRTAIQAHFYYPELIVDFLAKLGANGARYDLLLSTNEEAKAEILRAETASFSQGRVDVRVVPNRGRDIGPLLTSYGSELTKDYDVIGHLHGKRSSGVDATMGETWREFLWQHLLGARYPMLDIALAHFAENEQLGLIFPEEPHLCDWDDNLEIAQELAVKVGLETPLPPFFEFPVGSMFWARPKALAPLLELKLDWNDYPEEPLENDGTILHALERLVPFAAQREGYGYATVHIPGINR